MVIQTDKLNNILAIFFAVGVGIDIETFIGHGKQVVNLSLFFFKNRLNL